MLFGGTPGLQGACRGRRALLTARSSGKRRSVTPDSRRDGARRHPAKPAPVPQPRAQPAPFPAQSSSDAGQDPPQTPHFQLRNPRGPCCQGPSAREELGRDTALLFTDPTSARAAFALSPRRAGRLLGLLAPSSASWLLPQPFLQLFPPPSIATERERQRRGPTKASEKAHSKRRERFTSSSPQ